MKLVMLFSLQVVASLADLTAALSATSPQINATRLSTLHSEFRIPNQHIVIFDGHATAEETWEDVEQDLEDQPQLLHYYRKQPFDGVALAGVTDADFAALMNHSKVLLVEQVSPSFVMLQRRLIDSLPQFLFVLGFPSHTGSSSYPTRTS